MTRVVEARARRVLRGVVEIILGLVWWVLEGDLVLSSLLV